MTIYIGAGIPSLPIVNYQRSCFSRSLVVYILEVESRYKYRTRVYGKISCLFTSYYSLTGGNSPSVPTIEKLRWFIDECLSHFKSPELCSRPKLLSANNIGLCICAILVLR